MSIAVMETRMVFPGLEGDSTMAMKTPPVGPSTTSMVSPAPTADKSPSTNDPSTPRPVAAATTTQSSPAARVLAALKLTGQQGRLMFEEEPMAMGRAASAAQKGGMEKEKTAGSAGSGGDEFMLEKDHKTVNALWREYDEGVCGRPSVRSMIERDLKKSESQRKRWERRRIVINEIKRLKKERTTSAQAVVDAMDRFMKKKRLSMAKLQDRRLPDRNRNCRCGSRWLSWYPRGCLADPASGIDPVQLKASSVLYFNPCSCIATEA